MQRFTRSLTREIEVGGERLVLTLSQEGVSVRPLGKRRAPHSMSWETWLCACVAQVGDPQPTTEQIQQAIAAVREGGPEPKSQPAVPEAAAAPAVPATLAQPAAPSGPDMSALLARLDRWMAAHRPRFPHALQPGASAADCDGLASTLAQPLPAELRTLLQWHNGQNAEVPGAFEENWHLMSTAEIAAAKKELDAQPHEGWQRSWLPLFDDDSGNYLCVDLQAPDHPLRECWRGRADHPLAAPSLSAWLAKVVADLEAGAYIEDPERGSLLRRS